MKLFFRKNRGVWGIVFCVSKTRQYPKYGESGKRFALSFRKKAGGQSENFAALLHKPPSRPPFGCLSRHSLGSGGCRNKTGMDIPLRGCRGRNQPPKKSYLPILGTAHYYNMKSFKNSRFFSFAKDIKY